MIKELPAGAGGADDEDEEDEEDEEDSEEEAPPASAGRGKPNPADHAKNFLPLSGDAKKRPAAAPTATPPAKKAAPSPAPAASPAVAKPAASPAAGAANGKMGSQFSDGPAGTLGSRKFDNGLEIVNVAAGKPDGKVALMGKRCVHDARKRHCFMAAASLLSLCLCADTLTGICALFCFFASAACR